MNLRAIVIALVVVTVTLGFVAWQRSAQKATPETPPGGTAGEMPEMPGMPGAPAGDPGIAWNDPPGWTSEPGRGMRVVTYIVPGAGGDAQCPVFYFGPGQGGAVDANIERWIGEFSSAPSPERRTDEIGGMRVSRVQVKGTYQSHGAMGGGATGGEVEQADWMLLGAIVEGPNGSVFFKFAGPSATVASASPAFDAMLASLAKK